MRATLNDAGLPQAVASDDAWGVPETPLLGSFGFTGELQRGTDVWLRVRWYGAGRGAFASRDPYTGSSETPYSMMPYQYGYSNPLLWMDASGAFPISDADNMWAWIVAAKLIFDKFSTVGCAVDKDDGQKITDEVPELWLDYICEYGPRDRVFNGDALLTIKLAKTMVIERLRDQFYTNNQQITVREGHQMSVEQGQEAKIFDSLRTGRLLAITDFLGGFNAWRVTWDTTSKGEKTIRFEIYNETTLMSGTRIAASQEHTQEISMEAYLSNPALYNRHGESRVDALLLDRTRYSLISILSNKITRDPNTPWGLGGGTMTQRFIWEEPYNPCYWEQRNLPQRRPILRTTDYGMSWMSEG